jgi:hypothetical protein
MIAALNGGLDAASGELVAITDDDAVPRSDWLERIERHFADPSVGAVGGRDWVHEHGGLVDGSAQAVGLIRWYGRVVGNHHLGVGPSREVQVLKGANLAVRGAAVGPLRLDPELRGSGNQPHWEMDLCLGLRQSGWKVLYDPEVAVEHYPATRFDEDSRTDRPLSAVATDVHNETYVLLRRLPMGRRLAALAYGVLVGTRESPGLATAAEAVLRRRPVRHRLGAAMRGRRDALRAAVRKRGRPQAASPVR